jgi:hypothetical protein
MSDLFVAQYEGLVFVHNAIVTQLKCVVVATTDEIVALSRRAGGFLLAHHTIEDRVLFPMLRRAGRLRSTDVAALDSFDRAHHELHGLADRLTTVTSPAGLASLARDTLAVLTAHVTEEETGLAPDRLRTMVNEAELVEIGREADRVREELLAGQPALAATAAQVSR